jgi:hypothetical protein
VPNTAFGIAVTSVFLSITIVVAGSVAIFASSIIERKNLGLSST